MWQVQTGSSTIVQTASSGDFGATWSAPRTVVSSGTPVYPWIGAHGTTVAISLFHTDTHAANSSTVGAQAQWYERELESTDSGQTFGALTTVDPTPVKTGPTCTEGINCSGDRQLGDFQQVAVDDQNRPNLTWARVVSGADTEIRFARGG